MQELDRRITSLKLRLAEIESREQSLAALRRQYRQQIKRSVEYAIWAESHLDMALGVAEDVEAKLAGVETSLKHLGAIKSRAQDELQTLLLTRSVEDAKSQLAALERRRIALAEEIERLAGDRVAQDDLGAQSREVSAEIRRLKRVIDEASDEAARRISSARREATE